MQRPDPKKTNKEWNWSTYFAIKKQKLELQLEENKDGLGEVDESIKFLFKNIGIFVNGYTNPTSIELRTLMIKHGGCYHEYMNDRVTHIIASNLAHSKAIILKNRLVIKPEWILDSIKEKRLLNAELYALETSAHDKAQNKLTSFVLKGNVKENSCEKLLKSPKFAFQNDKDATFVDLTESPKVTKQTSYDIKKNLHEKDFTFFRNRIVNFKSEKGLKKDLLGNDGELENLKYLLDDWIFWTSKNNLDKQSKRQIINDEDLIVFQGYLLYILNVEKNIEKLTVILRILKRLIEKSGSFEWIENYKEILASVQADFYEEYNSTLNLF